jgi:hypothetical protein
MRKLLLIALTALCLNSYAQEPMVAYRVEGIWHYFNTDGKPMWQPYMDVAGFPAGWINGLLLASEIQIGTTESGEPELLHKRVLYNKKGEVVFDPKLKGSYDMFLSIDKAGFIPIHSYEEDILYIFDKTGKIVFQCPGTDAGYLNDGVVYYPKVPNPDGYSEPTTFVLYDIAAKKVLNEITCLGFTGSFESSVVLPYDENSRYGIVNRKGQLVQPIQWNTDDFSYDEANQLSGYAYLKDPATEKMTLFNQKGEAIVKDFYSVIVLKNGYFGVNTNPEASEVMWYTLKDGKATAMPNSESVSGYGTQDGVYPYLNDDFNLELRDASHKKLVGFDYHGDYYSLPHYFWIDLSPGKGDDIEFSIFDNKGKVVSKLKAGEVVEQINGMMLFSQNGKWGLAAESGKVLIPAVIETELDNILVYDDFLEYSFENADGDIEFVYYNFKGQKVMSTSPGKDGWDYLLQQVKHPRFYVSY